MQRNGKNKVLGVSISILLTCLLIGGSGMQTFASDTANVSEENTLTQKCAGVFEVNLVYMDDQNDAHIVKKGNGFLIGTEEESSYVVTSRETVCVEEELLTQTLQEYGLEQDTEIPFIPRLVIKNDVVMDAEVVVCSEEMGFAVLKLMQPIYGREALCFSPEPHKVQAMDPVYSLWCQDNVTEGQIFKRLEEEEISFLWHTSIMNNMGSGSPLLDEQGNVIGINTELLETGYMQAVDIEEVITVLDVFGVPYTVAEAVEMKPVTEQKDSVRIPDAAEEHVETPAETEQLNVTEEYTAITETEPLPVIFWIGIGVVVLMMAGIIILVYKIVTGDRKKEKDETTYQENIADSIPPIMPYQQPIAFSEETTVLGVKSPAGMDVQMDIEATTILSNRTGMEECRGYLIREKNGERIYLNKSLFVIGSDGLRVDYCIRDNKAVSRVHAQIRRMNAAYTLEELHATNGTFLNGVKLQDSEVKPLNPGDCIRLANEEFIFYI